MEPIPEILARITVGEDGSLTLSRYKGFPFVSVEAKPSVAGSITLALGDLKRAHRFLDEAFGDDQ